LSDCDFAARQVALLIVLLITSRFDEVGLMEPGVISLVTLRLMPIARFCDHGGYLF
jgi:hypothetical protein